MFAEFLNQFKLIACLCDNKSCVQCSGIGFFSLLGFTKRR